jgi:hypothetical protein
MDLSDILLFMLHRLEFRPGFYVIFANMGIDEVLLFKLVLCLLKI